MLYVQSYMNFLFSFFFWLAEAVVLTVGLVRDVPIGNPWAVANE